MTNSKFLLTSGPFFPYSNHFSSSSSGNANAHPPLPSLSTFYYRRRSRLMGMLHERSRIHRIQRIQQCPSFMIPTITYLLPVDSESLDLAQGFVLTVDYIQTMVPRCPVDVANNNVVNNVANKHGRHPIHMGNILQRHKCFSFFFSLFVGRRRPATSFRAHRGCTIKRPHTLLAGLGPNVTFLFQFRVLLKSFE